MKRKEMMKKMEYPFKDLLPLGEVLEREGYYKDWTHLDPEVFYSLTQISNFIKTKGYGVDVRLLIAQLAEHFGLKTTQVVDLANLLQQKFENLEGVTQSFTNNINSLVAQMEAEKNAVIANATVDSEVILARGGNVTLGERLDDTDTQLAQITKSILDIKTLGIIGDGSIDETEKLQEIVDYSRNENVKVINYDKNLIINISKPIYFDGGEDIDFGYANINKTTNTKGEGSNVLTNRTDSNGDYIVDDYAVDAHFIFRHEDNKGMGYLNTVNIHFGTTAPNRHEFAIFAPRVHYWQIENITATHYRFDKLIFSYSMWQIPKFNNIEFRGGHYLLEIANDGANIGASTSISANQLYAIDGKGILKIYSCAYSTFTNVFGNAHSDVSFVFTACRSITVNSPEIETLTSGKFAWITASHITFNSPSAFTLSSATAYAYLWNIENSKVVINAGRFPEYSAGSAAGKLGLNVGYGSHVTLNQCTIPGQLTNPDFYIGELSQGSTVTIIDEKGVTVRSAEGAGTMFGGRKIYSVTGVPKTGKWNKGEIALSNNYLLGGTLGFVCTISGEFGTGQEPQFERMSSIQPRLRQQQFGTESPKDGYWRKGDIVINTNPTYGNGVFAWVCVNEGYAPTQADFRVLKLTTE